VYRPEPTVDNFVFIVSEIVTNVVKLEAAASYEYPYLVRVP
jgi:hypothetical protein